MIKRLFICAFALLVSPFTVTYFVIKEFLEMLCEIPCMLLNKHEYVNGCCKYCGKDEVIKLKMKEKYNV